MELENFNQAYKLDVSNKMEKKMVKTIYHGLGLGLSLLKYFQTQNTK